VDNAPPRRKKWIWWLLGVLFAAALLFAALYLLGSGGASARYDTAESVLADYDGVPGAYVIEPDGAITVRLDRQDLYYIASRYGLLEPIRAGIRERTGRADTGFRISDGRITVYTRSRLLGFLPVSFRADMDMRLEKGPDQLVLWAERVRLGGHVNLPRRLWPALLEEEIRLPLESVSREIIGVAAEGEALMVRLEGLPRLFTRNLYADRDLLAAIALFRSENIEENTVLSVVASLPGTEIPMGDALSRVLSAGDPNAAFSRLLSCCTAGSVVDFWDGADPLTREVLGQGLRRQAVAFREALEGNLTAEQSKYEKLLTSVRESYKSLSLIIDENAFINTATGEAVDPGALSRLSATATDCRIVFLYSSSGGGELSTGDMPPLTEIPRTGKQVMQELSEETPYDLGVALTSEGDTPVLLYRRADGAFVMRQIDDTVYVELLVSRSNPILDIDALPTPGREILRAAGEGWTDCVIWLLGEEEDS